MYSLEAAFNWLAYNSDLFPTYLHIGIFTRRFFTSKYSSRETGKNEPKSKTVNTFTISVDKNNNAEKKSRVQGKAQIKTGIPSIEKKKLVQAIFDTYI